jgi:hypothetical protein
MLRDISGILHALKNEPANGWYYTYDIGLLMWRVQQEFVYFFWYGNGFDKRIARQQLRKHGPTRNTRTTRF